MPDASAWHPRLPPAARLRHDQVRNTDVLLLPERVIVLHGSGRAVLDLVDGTRTVDEIIAALVPDPVPDTIRDDVISFLHKLRTEGSLR
ncbi:pyrroloquinoline quinone biosynthesis peptide chaperone PqqD [Streptomyces sp. NBC_00659]|uniref:pyrroloquinoline quinone biosynthesis peptide chaperone PqqD n=1 Tax=Streptomyces sp. NBC_00659 TaxID=2903669 RepID=UPI002E34B140|nr:pyrroloquinoline quinone biosynthesis peptide chaperone PqqD [Streptomyces sp. NBC_00659]